MLSFTTFGSASATVRYYVEHGADCARSTGHGLEPSDGTDPAAGNAVDYYGEGGRSDGVWLGSGAAALGLSGPVTGEQVPVLTRLLSGQLPDGTVVSKPVWRPHPDGRLPAAPLLAAVGEAAVGRGVGLADLLGSDELRSAFGSLSGRVERTPGAVAHPQALADLAAAAGVDLNGLYGAGSVAVAFAQAEVKVDVRRAGADGPLSAPKSASLLWALGDHHTGVEVLAAHRSAVGETVAYLERWAGHALRGHQGDGKRATRVGTDGLIVAGFEHLTSRADDPQLHTHLVIANLLHGDDGKWSALDTRALFRVQRTAGYLYQAVLRGELTRRLGVSWTPVAKGMAEIADLPAALLAEFSTRRIQITARMRATGATGSRAARVACLGTRPAKSGRPVTELLGEWWDRARGHVPDPTALVRAVLGRGTSQPLDQLDLDRLTGWLLGPEGVTRSRSGFDRGELTRDLLEALPAGTALTAADIEHVVDRLLRDDRVLPLVPDCYGTRRYTTVELASTEHHTLRLAAAATTVPTSQPLVALSGLSGEQTDAVYAVTTSPAAVDVVLGPAGAGKTAMLAALHAHYRQLGVPVVGACVAAVAARRLQTATAIPSTSLARMLHGIGAGDPLPASCVVVVDEAGMVGTRDYQALLTAVTAAGGKLVAVGDRAQLTEIDAGGMFARLSRHRLAAELTDNHRQAHPWERDALTALRTGDVDAALAAYRSHDRLHHAATREQLIDRIADNYVQALAAGTPATQVVALAATRTGADQLNAAIRTRLREHGRLGADQPVGSDATFAEGELVMVSRNDHGRGLLNGARGTITALTDRQVTLHLDGDDDDRTVTVPGGWAADRLRPAYAMTVHKAQGLTVDVALVDTTGLADRNAGYVAASRARHNTQLYHTSDTDLHDALRDDPFTTAHAAVAGVRGADLQAQLARRLARRREQRLASSQLLAPAAGEPMHRLIHDDPGRDRGYGRSR